MAFLKGKFFYVFIFVILSLFSLNVNSCGYGALELFHHGAFVDERTDQLTELGSGRVGSSFDSLSGSYTFVIFSDPHYGSKRADNIDEAEFLEWLDSLSVKPKFCICLGDIADHGERSEFEKYNAFASRIESITGGKVYGVVGNHDLYNSGWDDFEDLVYPNVSFYRFAINSISYYFLDTGSGSMGTTQFNKFKAAMAADSNYKIVCTHYPCYGTKDFFASYYSLQNTLEADQLITLLKKQKAIAYLSGHMHAEHSTDFGTFTEYVVPAFLSNEKFAVMTVNESNHTATYKSYSY